MDNNKSFYLSGGKTITDLKSLAKELMNMSQDVYVHHVNPAKNDFANWIKYSLKHDDLAQKIENKIDKIELELEVLRHLVHQVSKKAVVKKVKVKTEIKEKPTPVKKEVVKKNPVKKKTISKKVVASPAN